MNRHELAAYLTDTYGTVGEHLFAKYPSFLVFRHSGNRKWFAVIMDIPRKNLKLSGKGVPQLYGVMQKAGLQAVTCQQFPNARQDIFHEQANGTAQSVCHCIADWLTERF